VPRAAAGLIAFFLLTASAQAADPVFGTWTLDLSRSKGNTFTCYVTTLDDLGNGKFREIAKGIGIRGKVLNKDTVMAFDGGDHPNGFGEGLTTAFTRVDDQRYMMVFKNRRTTYAMVMRTVSADGKTMIDTGDGTIRGKPFHTELVFTRLESDCSSKP
jgi:hypothetical protein